MRRVVLFSLGAVLALVAIVSLFRGGPPDVRPLTEADARGLATLKEGPRRERLKQLAEKARTGAEVPQLLLVQAVEAGRVVVVDAPGDDVSDNEPATGWDIPWTTAREAIAKEPTAAMTVSGSYQSLGYRHGVYPVSVDDGTYLLVNSAAPNRPVVGWRGALLGIALIIVFLAIRSEA